MREDYPDLLDRQLTWGIWDDVGLVDNTGEWHDRGHAVASGIGEYKDAQMAEDGGIHSLLARGG